MSMRTLFIVLAASLFFGCQPQESAAPEDTTGLPMASSMKTEGEVKAPRQAVEFCNRHPDDFEAKCP